MKRKLFISIFFICVQFLFINTMVYAVPITPYKFYSNMPDNSQFAEDYTPAPAHGTYWGDMMCGPTSAKNSMVWLAETNPAYDKLKKKKVGENWVDMSHDEIIEELAEKMRPNWTWGQEWTDSLGKKHTTFPGVFDDGFVKGKKEFAESRGLKLDIKWMKNKTLNLNWGRETVGEPTLDWIMKEIDEDEDVEISTTEHWVTVDVDTTYWMKEWVTVAGYMGDKFEDENNNGLWDEGEFFWDENYLGIDIGSIDIYDSFLYINDPWNKPDGNDGWQLAETINGKLYVGSLGYIETVVSESPIPEPATMLLLGSGLICLLGFRKKLRNKQQ